MREDDCFINNHLKRDGFTLWALQSSSSLKEGSQINLIAVVGGLFLGDNSFRVSRGVVSQETSRGTILIPTQGCASCERFDLTAAHLATEMQSLLNCMQHFSWLSSHELARSQLLTSCSVVCLGWLLNLWIEFQCFLGVIGSVVYLRKQETVQNLEWHSS